MKKVNIYTATTFRGMKPQDGAIGYVLEYVSADGKEATKTHTEKLIQSTPNYAELRALNDALERMTMPCELVIYTESGYIKRGLEYWVKGWERSNWKSAHGKEIKHKNEWKMLYEKLQQHQYTINAGMQHRYRGWMEMQLKETEKE